MHSRHLFVNPAYDLLKFVRFFSAAKTYLGEKSYVYRSKKDA